MVAEVQTVIPPLYCILVFLSILPSSPVLFPGLINVCKIVFVRAKCLHGQCLICIPYIVLHNLVVKKKSVSVGFKYISGTLHPCQPLLVPATTSVAELTPKYERINSK